ncbi:MAG TPA: zinc dependent phospholipase C family protein [Anseongella sp.]
MQRHKHLLLAGLLICTPAGSTNWGFYAHRKINRTAVFTLPPPMIVFYKRNLDYITSHAVNADKRRYVLEDEAARHYFDAENYGPFFPEGTPPDWQEAEQQFPASHFQEHGILPWHIIRMTHRLTDAFLRRDSVRILRYSADLGHYLADAHVPLHTTENYNGQLSDQTGIHAFWESRLPELFATGYDLFTGKAHYIRNIPQETWRIVRDSHKLVDSVLRIEKELSREFPADRKYTVFLKNNRTVKNYSEHYSALYQKRLQGMVERRLTQAILAIGSFWFTAWVNAGQPSLQNLEYRALSPEEKQLEEKTNGDPAGRSMLGRKE